MRRSTPHSSGTRPGGSPFLLVSLNEKVILRKFNFFIFPILVAAAGCGPLSEQFNQKGAEAFRRHDLAAAKKEFGRAILISPSNPTLHNNLGFVLYQSKDLLGAEAEFLKGLSDHPNETLLRQIQINQSLLYGDYGPGGAISNHKDWTLKGVGVLIELLKKEPDNAEFHMRLGFAYFQMANPGGGFLELDKAVQFAVPQVVARYSPQPVQGALSILDQIQAFYMRIRYYKRAAEIQIRIKDLKKSK